MKKTVKNRLTAVAVAGCAVLALTGGALIISGSASASSGGATFTEIALNEEYEMNTVVEFPRVTMTLDGKEYATQSVLHNPDGTAQFVNGSASLQQMGNYSVEYKATVANVTYSTQKDIYVYKPKFQLSGANDIAEYRNNAVADMSGEYVSLSQDSTLVINDYFDITKANPSKPIFEASIIPAVQGTEDFQTLTVRFVSKKNPSEYLTVVCNYYPYNNCTYFQAGANTQTPAGYESYQDTIHVGNEWGAPYSGSFRGTPHSELTVQQDTLKIYLDYESKIIYANHAKGFVIDLDDAKYFGTLWSGFSDGEVYIEVSASRFTASNPAQMLIVRAGDIDLTEQLVYDTTPPILTVDTEGYAENELPNGVVGKPYKIFDAVAEDYLSGDCAVDVHVYGRYYGSQKYEERITDGYFTPKTAGVYVIEYSATDKSNNTVKKRVPIEVIDNADEIALTLADKTESGKAGEIIPIAKVTAVGGTGKLAVKTEVTLDGKSITLSDGGFRPMSAGIYTVEITATDYVGASKKESYTVDVSVNNKPIFIDDVILPAYLIAGSEYSFDEVYAYDFGSAEYKKVKAVLVTEDKNGVQEHPDGKYTPSVNAHLDTVNVWYKATAGGVASESEKREITVCSVGTGSSVDIGKYFVSDDVDAQATNEGMVLTTATDNARTDFANPLMANNLTLSFNVDRSKCAFTTLNVYLRDSVNSEERIKISYDKSSGNSSFMSVNDGMRYTIPASFTGDSSYNFELKFDNRNAVVAYGNDVKLNVPTTASGKPFTGFTSGKVYVTFEFAGVRADSSIVLSELGGQRMTNVTVDLIKPKIDLFEELGFRYSIGDEVKLAAAVAVDVLDPNVSSSYTVTTPSGEIAKDINGKELKNIPVSESYTIKLTEYGIYRVSYIAVDWNGRTENNFSYALEVVDTVAPIILLNGEVPSEAKLGDKMNLPMARATDAIDGNRDVFAYVLRPDGRYVAYDNTMSFDMVGKYTVVYYSFDEAGNTAKLTFDIIVKGGV